MKKMMLGLILGLFLVFVYFFSEKDNNIAILEYTSDVQNIQIWGTVHMDVEHEFTATYFHVGFKDSDNVPYGEPITINYELIIEDEVIQKGRSKTISKNYKETDRIDNKYNSAELTDNLILRNGEVLEEFEMRFWLDEYDFQISKRFNLTKKTYRGI